MEPKAIQFLSKKGFDPHFGARPLKRIIQKELLNPLANRIISKELKKGDTVFVTSSDLSLIFRS